MHYRCLFTLLNWLCAGRIRLGWAHDVFTITYHMLIHFHAYVLYISLYSYILNCIRTFLIVFFSLSLSLSLVCVSCIMAPKCKFVPSQNPLHSGASTSFDPTPSLVWFHDEKAKTNFLKNFSRWGIHSERQVILSDFSDTDLPTVIHSRG